MQLTHISCADHATAVLAEHFPRGGDVRLNTGVVKLQPGDWVVTDRMGRQVVWKHEQFVAAFEPIRAGAQPTAPDPLEVVAAYVNLELEKHRQAGELLKALAALVIEVKESRREKIAARVAEIDQQVASNEAEIDRLQGEIKRREATQGG